MLAKIQRCVRFERLLYTKHARDEMESEELGQIGEEEICEVVTRGKIIEDYPEDEPYPSCLIFGYCLCLCSGRRHGYHNNRL
jgi:hypothetical protein